MIQWRFAAGNPALETVTGRKEDGLIRSGDDAGYVLFGPYLELPAGRCTARIALAGPSRGRALMELSSHEGRQVIASQPVDLAAAGDAITMSVDIAETAPFVEVRLKTEAGAALAIAGVEIDLVRDVPDAALDPDRPVGFESRKTYADKVAEGFFDTYLSGPAVLEVGYKGYIGGTVPIVPQAIGVDLGYPGYDGVTLPFADNSFDAIYSSHCFEHIPDYKAVLRDWYRLLRIGGYIVIVVPHQHMFEKRRNPPSPSNPDHKRFYTVESLAREIAEAFDENSYRIRRIAENDRGFNYADGPRADSHGCYEIECVIEKIARPIWNLDDGTVRTYAASEFSTNLPRPDPWTIAIDAARDAIVLWGPYVVLGKAAYEVDFYFDTSAMGDLTGDITVDIARDTHDIASLTVSGGEGQQRLRSGPLTVRFENDDPQSFYEFRVRTSERAFPGTLAFRGVEVRWVAP